MKKILISVLVVIILLIGVYRTFNYFNGPKIIKGVVAKSIDDNGKPIEFVNEFSLDDTVYFSAKGKKFLAKKAQVVWYKGKVATENRFLVEDDIDISEEGYFSAKLSLEGLEEGLYSVSIYKTGHDILQTHVEFYVKK